MLPCGIIGFLNVRENGYYVTVSCKGQVNKMVNHPGSFVLCGSHSDWVAGPYHARAAKSTGCSPFSPGAYRDNWSEMSVYNSAIQWHPYQILGRAKRLPPSTRLEKLPQSRFYYTNQEEMTELSGRCLIMA